MKDKITEGDFKQRGYRICNLLAGVGITLWSQIVGMRASELWRLPGVGGRTFRNISDAMKAKGLSFVSDATPDDAEELGPSDIRIKANVRHRDGYRCRKCGMTEQEHQQQHEQTLHVHRLIPGTDYTEFGCVTLCRGCHDEMPRSMEQVYFGEARTTGVYMHHLNLFDEVDHRVYCALKQRAETEGEGVGQALDRVLYRWADQQGHDYCI